ncbi:hypothetical protein PLICRDRAFT_668352 [Plicaturopsis crispa FD-325 SS-3]|nr:hypothetical protein PLICRDRAFT_668352 [Plicaturopsis crispa FD-325 SS-3]
MSTSLGKRKERDDATTLPHGSTLFVSNLPYTATSTDLQTLFSDIAPVRSAFVVLEQGTGVSKGVGYVSFAIKEDAQAAFDKLSKEGILLDRRNLRVQWADSKPKEGAEVVKKEPKPRPPPRAPHPTTVHDPNAIRTIVISGLPPALDSNTLWKKVRKYTGAEKVEWPVSGSDDPSIAHALFDTANHAQEAVNKLHAHVFKGCLLSVALKKRLDGLSKAPRQPAESTSATSKKAAPNRASRLIVRNIPWNISEQDLRAIFLPHGPIHSIHIPVEKAEGDEAAKPRAKGFAFVWMMSRGDAEKAMEHCNGMAVRAGMAETMVSGKQKRKKQLREEKKKKSAAAAGEVSDEEVAETVERVIAVDWALSKEKWQEEKAKMQDDDVEMAAASGSDSDSESESGSESDEESALGVHDHDGDSSGTDDSDPDSDADSEEQPVKPQLPPPETGTTLFIRNVPFAATDDELRTLFRGFGPLRYARITMDPGSGRSRGTGFACFWNKADADKVVEQSDLLRAETTGSAELQPKKNPFTLPSILTPDPSSTLAQSLVLHGRTLDVVRAVTRDEASKLKDDGERKREKADKRNMYLLREGVILPNTPAADTLGPIDVEKRTNSYNARRALLRSNPSLYISKTRLSVRQIPLFATERLLRRLAVHAIRAFESDVKKGLRVGLTEDELATVVDEAAAEDPKVKVEEKEKGKKGWKAAGRDTGVKQAKIVRQQERVDPITGKGRSKGYGFLEMHKHADALRVLRWANNNPEIGPMFEQWWKDELADLVKREKQSPEKDGARLKRMQDELEKGSTHNIKGTLIVEFSIENVQVVQRRSALQKEKPAVRYHSPCV